jgi:hypothetical protein
MTVRVNLVLLFIGEARILQVSVISCDHLPSPQSENFCQKARKKHATTFVMRALPHKNLPLSVPFIFLSLASSDTAMRI